MRRATIVGLCLSLFTPAILAQTPKAELETTTKNSLSDQSRRDTLVTFLSDYYDLEQISVLPQNSAEASSPATPLEPTADITTDNNQPSTEDIIPEPEEAKASTPQGPSPLVDIPKSKDKSSPIVPFFIKAEDYLSARKMSDAAALVLDYDVIVTDESSRKTLKDETNQLTIGADFAASLRADDSGRIFDFGLKRLITLLPENGDKPASFTHLSLYAPVYRAIRTVNAATKNGTIDTVSIGPEQTLDVTWMEAGLGWSGRNISDTISITADDTGTLSGSYKHEIVFTITPSDTPWPSDNYVRSFYAYILHDLSIHPAFFEKLGKLETVPKSMTVLAKNPTFPNGVQTQWSLTNVGEGDFPLSVERVNINQTDEANKTAKLLVSAAANPINKDVETQALSRRLEQDLADGDLLNSWRNAKILSERLGGCDAADSDLCQTIAAIEQKADGELGALITAFNNLAVSEKRLEALIAIKPFLANDSTPAFILKAAGRARGQIKTKDADGTSIAVLDPSMLLERALSKDPYDPETYLYLARVYAANEKMNESWDMQDALRYLPDAPEVMTAPITRAERAILARAPGFFAPSPASNAQK